MKVAFYAGCFALLLASCQKSLSDKEESLSAVVSSNALQPMPCHSTSFVTGYPVAAGKVPPFKFTKTLYSDTRVRTINMLSRANPIHPAFKPQAWELIGQFSYSKNAATFTGTKELWEYYKTSTGAPAKKSILKKNVQLRFSFYTDQDPGSEEAMEAGTCYLVQNVLTNKMALRTYLFPYVMVGEGSDDPTLNFSVNYITDSELIFKTENASEPKYQKTLTFKYGAGAYVNKRNISYQPTQNWISLEYTLLEVMQWLPSWYRPFVERSGVAVEFYPYNDGQKVVQSQVYKNHQYDAKGNMLSFTYGDNVLQKTTWYCK